MLALLVVLPLIGGLLAWAAGRRSAEAARWCALIFTGAELVLVLGVWIWALAGGGLSGGTPWLLEERASWIPQLGIGWHLGMDGLSLLLVGLTAFLGVLGVAASWSEVTERVGFFHFNLMWVLSGVVGVFLALDLVLFYFFWELMLVPMYFLIGIWGHERRVYAAIKFFLFTQASGLLMLVSILGLHVHHAARTGERTFDYLDLLGASLSPGLGLWLMLGFFVAFAVKLPAFLVHTWLPDAHTEAPTAGSVILAGLLLKTGGYGLLRFNVPLFPEASQALAPYAMILGAIGVLYGAVLAFAQTDVKRLVAYSSVSHLGFVLVGVFAWNELAHQGVVVQMVSHGLSTGGLFVVAGLLQERLHTREWARMGGLWRQLPRMGGLGLVLALASLGLPGLGNFVAEFLILVGSYQAWPLAAVLCTVGLILATIYSLWIIQQVFHGGQRTELTVRDLGVREVLVLGAMVAVLIWIGLFPQTVLDTAAPALAAVRALGIGG